MGLNAKRPSTTRDKEMEKAKAALMDEAEEKTKRLNVIVEESLLKRMKSFALEEGKTVSEITRELWLTHMNR
jgi:hypothetical protein